jgi:hypothetical protein
VRLSKFFRLMGFFESHLSPLIAFRLTGAICGRIETSFVIAPDKVDNLWHAEAMRVSLLLPSAGVLWLRVSMYFTHIEGSIKWQVSASQASKGK